MASFGIPGSNFGSGLLQGFQVGNTAGTNAAELETKRAMAALKSQETSLKYQERIRGLFEEAFQVEDPALRGGILDSVAKSIEKETGRKVNPIVMKLFKSDTEQARNLMSAINESGMTMGELFTMTGDNLATAEGLIAFAQHSRVKAMRAAAGGLPTTGAGANVASPSGETAPAAAPKAPTPELQATLDQTNARIAQLEQSRARAIDLGAKNPQALKGIDDELNRLRTLVSRITVDPQLDAIKEGGKLISPEMAAQLQVPPTTTVEQLRNIIAQRQGGAPVRETAPTDAAAEARARALDAQGRQVSVTVTPGAQTTPGTGAGGRTTPMTPGELASERETAERRARPIPENILRDKSVIASGAKTLGELEDGIASGRIRITDAVTLERLQANQKNSSKLAFEELQEVQKAADTARMRLDLFGVLSATATRLGPSGPWITPVKTTLYKLAQMVGIQNPEKMADHEIASSMATKLAVAGLKDVGGNDTDRELMTLMQSGPSGLASPRGMYTMIAIGAHLEGLKIEKELQANRWINAPWNITGDLRATDPSGKSFKEVFQTKILDKYPAYKAAAYALGLNFDALTKEQRAAEFKRALGIQ